MKQSKVAQYKSEKMRQRWIDWATTSLSSAVPYENDKLLMQALVATRPARSEELFDDYYDNETLDLDKGTALLLALLDHYQLNDLIALIPVEDSQLQAAFSLKRADIAKLIAEIFSRRQTVKLMGPELDGWVWVDPTPWDDNKNGFSYSGGGRCKDCVQILMSILPHKSKLQDGAQEQASGESPSASYQNFVLGKSQFQLLISNSSGRINSCVHLRTRIGMKAEFYLSADERQELVQQLRKVITLRSLTPTDELRVKLENLIDLFTCESKIV